MGENETNNSGFAEKAAKEFGENTFYTYIRDDITYTLTFEEAIQMGGPNIAHLSDEVLFDMFSTMNDRYKRLEAANRTAESRQRAIDLIAKNALKREP